MHGKHRVHAGDLKDAQNPRIGRYECETPAGGLRVPRRGDEHADGRRVEEGAPCEIDDEPPVESRAEKGFLELGGGRHVQLPLDAKDRPSVRKTRLGDLEVAYPCHGDECRRTHARPRAERAPGEARVTDTIVLTIPNDAGYRGVATLVVGGVGTRLDLPYERMDELQLAVLSVLDAGEGTDVTVEVTIADGSVDVSIGPLAAGSAGDPALARVVHRLVDEMATTRRNGDEWVVLRLSSPPGAG